MGEDPPPRLRAVLASAARLQRAVPDAVLVGDAAAGWPTGHRESFDHDHDHVLGDLAERYAQILEAVEATEGWVTSVRASPPPLTLLGSLDGIEAGLRQLRRTRPLEVEEVRLPQGNLLRVPTLPEMLRVKAFLVLQRNVVRDYLDTVALAERIGRTEAVTTLAAIDAYYADRSGEPGSVLTGVVQRLSEPNPRDTRVTRQLPRYKGLDPRWHRWETVVDAAQSIADGIVERLEGG